MPTSDCFVTVVAPLHNNAQVVDDFVRETLEVLRENFRDYELLLVNDGSQDETQAKVMQLLSRWDCVRLINLSRHFGTDIAISSGLDSAIGDFVVIMIPGASPPGLVPELIRQARGGWDILIGVRENRRDDPLWLRAGASLFYWFFQKMFQIPLVKNSTYFWVLSRQVLNAIIQVDTNHRHLRLLTAHMGYRSRTFVYRPLRGDDRPGARRFTAAVNSALQLVIFNSVLPLRLTGGFVLLASFANLVYAIVSALMTATGPFEARPWAALSVQNSLMFFLIALTLATLCEYASVLFERSRGWMAYYVSNEQTSNVLLAGPERKNIVAESAADPSLGVEGAAIDRGYAKGP